MASFNEPFKTEAGIPLLTSQRDRVDESFIHVVVPRGSGCAVGAS